MHTRVLTNSNEFAKYAKCVRVCVCLRAFVCGKLTFLDSRRLECVCVHVSV